MIISFESPVVMSIQLLMKGAMVVCDMAWSLDDDDGSLCLDFCVNDEDSPCDRKMD